MLQSFLFLQAFYNGNDGGGDDDGDDGGDDDKEEDGDWIMRY